MNVMIDLNNVQEQMGESSEQLRKTAHRAALAYAGLWAMAFDSAKAGLEGSSELLEKAEKRGEEVEEELTKQYKKYREMVMDEVKSLQARAGDVVNLDEVSETVTSTVNESAKVVQQNVGKALNRVGVSGRQDLPETVIEVSTDMVAEFVAPFAEYDEMTAKELVAKFDELTVEQLEVIREYEANTKNRVTVLRDLDERLDEAIVA